MIASLSRRRIAMCICLTALLAVLSLSLAGCRGKKTESAYGPGNKWVDDMREQIQDKIDDPQKVTDLLVVVDQIEKTLIDLDQDVKDYYTALTKLDKNYNATREEFQDAIDQFNAARHEHVEKMLGYMFEMKRIAGQEDWKKLSDIDKTLYENWQRAYEL
ncbi:MAG: hypothetical protein KAJ37_00670 [Candidatus Krumholzibacteria bacterium]|nr:hypothetical protein [Candidatus Krumholzibacteria bacterium]